MLFGAKKHEYPKFGTIKFFHTFGLRARLRAKFLESLCVSIYNFLVFLIIIYGWVVNPSLLELIKIRDAELSFAIRNAVCR